MKNLILLSGLSIFWTTAAFAQTPGRPAAADSTAAAPLETVQAMTFDECMAYAVQHSPAVQRQVLTNANYRQSYISAIADLTPSISGGVSANASFGRSVDPSTNTYTDVSNFGNAYSISASLPIFDGLAGINRVRAARVMRLLGIEALQQQRDQVALRTMEACFDVAYYTESCRLAAERLSTTQALLAKTRKLHDLGLKSEADVAEIEAQTASDDYLLTQQQNALEQARITLAETMNYPLDRPLNLDTDIRIEPAAVGAGRDEVLAYALDHHPKALQAACEVRNSRLELAAARGRYLPSLSVSGGYSTDFYMSLDDRSLYADFGSQFRDNRSYYVSARLSIPIFNGLSRRTAVNRARNNLRIAEQQQIETQRALQSEVAQAWQQMTGTGKEFVSASKKSASAALAYAAMEAKYEHGLISSIDLQTAANNLLQARAERLRARLQYVMKSRLVAYYNGMPLVRTAE